MDQHLPEHLVDQGGPVLSRPRHRSGGFTFIEVLVAMTIFAVLVTLGIPAMRSWVSDTKVRAVADALQNGIRLSQAEALRRSRQVVFSLTNSNTPSTGTFSASANGNYWAIMTVPLMTDGTETPTFVESGVLTSAGSNVQITGPAEICFNSAGRLVANPAPGVGGGACTLPANNPPVYSYVVTLTGADHPMQVNLTLGGQTHLCDPTQTLSATNPYGC
jgi:type IV fimbrial biogenesis protein FimT